MCTLSSTEFSKIPEARHLNFPTLYYSIVSQNMIRKLGRRATSFFPLCAPVAKRLKFSLKNSMIFFLNHQIFFNSKALLKLPNFYALIN
jgi:hypothetical protein